MIERTLFKELNERIGEALRGSPAQDIERNLRGLLEAWFDRLDLVLREDFEVQKKLLQRARSRCIRRRRSNALVPVVRRVARAIADLAASIAVSAENIGESIQYRRLDASV